MNVFTAIAAAIFRVAFLSHLVAFAVGLLALSIFAETSTHWSNRCRHHLVLHFDAVEAAVAQETHIVGLARADAVVLKAITIITLALMTRTLISVT